MSAAVGLSPHRHVVELYEEEADLATHVARYLFPGLRAGYPTIVVATPSLRTHVESALSAFDTDLDRARANKTLVELDAEEVLDAISVNGRVDGKAFDRVIGGVARSFPTGVPIPAFGQMVGLLWERGNLPGALALEGMWNRLSRELAIHAYCGFQAAGVMRTDDLRLLANVHDQVVLTSSVEPLQLAPELASSGIARRFAIDVMDQWELTELREEVEVVVSELVTNAVVHTRSTSTLSIARQGRLVRIAVRDSSRELPIESPMNPFALTGRGLGIVRSIAADVGTFVAPDGKTVWAHLETGAGRN